jgi:hypothetical protein
MCSLVLNHFFLFVCFWSREPLEAATCPKKLDLNKNLNAAHIMCGNILFYNKM